MHTDTKFVIPDPAVQARIASRGNNRPAPSGGRHFTNERPTPAPKPGRHRVDDSATRLIPVVPPVVEFKASVPLPPRPVAPEAPVRPVPVAMPSEPTEPISDNLLERVLRGLRKLRGTR